MSLPPRMRDGPKRRARPRGGIVLLRSPFEPPIIARGVAVGLLLAAVVAALGWPLAAATPLAVEVGVLEQLGPGGPSWLRGLALVVSSTGHLLSVVAVALVVALVARWRWGGWDLGLLLLTAFGGASAVTAAVKLVTARTRPGEAVVETLNSAFPSGHAVRAAAVYGLIAWLALLVARRGWIRVLVPVLALGTVVLSSLARLALLAHWPSDVAVGVVVGAVWLAVTVYLLRPRTLAELGGRDEHPSPPPAG